MYFRLAAMATVVATVCALPNVVDSHQEEKFIGDESAIAPVGVCKKMLAFIPTKPVCCIGDILGLIHHGYEPCFPTPPTVVEFVNGCIDKGKAAQCCVTNLAGVGLLCHAPTGAGSSTDILESVNGNTAKIVEIFQSNGESTASTVIKKTKKLTPEELEMLSSIPVPTVKIQKNKNGKTELEIIFPDGDTEVVEVDAVIEEQTGEEGVDGHQREDNHKEN